MNINVAGQEMEAELVGKGSWTKAYKVAETVFLQVFNCPFKKEFSEVNHPLLPHLEEIGGGWFKSPFYADITSDVHKEIVDIIGECYRSSYYQYFPSREKTLDYFANEVRKDLGDSYASAIEVCNSLLLKSKRPNCDYDIGERNFGVDSNGNLIFRDVLADYEAVTMREELNEH